MKGLRLKTGGDANLEFIKGVSPVLAKSYSTMLSNIKDPANKILLRKEQDNKLQRIEICLRNNKKLLFQR